MMKNLKALLIVLFIALTTVASAQNKKSEKAVIKTNIVCDHCKACETCGLNFKENMLKVKVQFFDLCFDVVEANTQFCNIRFL